MPSVLSVRTAVTLCVALMGSSSRGSDAPASVRPAVGAIRWDAWHGDKSVGGRAVLKTLAPPQWRGRLPFFARVTPEGSIGVDGDTDEIMAQEIAYAKTAGLSYWAFVAYAPDDPMSLGLRRYLASERRGEIRFCIISEAHQWAPSNSAAHAQRFADLMKLPNHQTTAAGRPLFFFLNQRLPAVDKTWEAAGGFGAAVGALRDAARQRGLPEPYIVAMSPRPADAKAFAEASGCDAISAYATNGGAKRAPYSELAKWTENFWEECKATGAKVVPLAMSGWDRRPRVENPVPWERNEGWAADWDRYYEPARPDELAAHVARAVQWSQANPQTVDAQAIIIYAWNEHDEGGWLCPTLGEGDARVRALGQALSRK